MENVCKIHHSREALKAQDLVPSRGYGLRKYVLRWYNLPHKRLKLEKDICDVEDSQKPLIIIANKV